MTPSARLAAAAQVLDTILSGTPAEAALTGWARGSRFAGSGDRAAVRTHVYDALRRRRSLIALSGSGRTTGRALVIGLVRESGGGFDGLFAGMGHGLSPLTPAETESLKHAAPPALAAEALDVADWTEPLFRETLGEATEASLMRMRQRAPVFLRVNLGRITLPDVMAALLDEGIAAIADPLSDTALRVVDGAQRVGRSRTYLEGLVELQDAASQAACALVPLRHGMRVLDLCAGGGGKSLALAALALSRRISVQIDASDISPQRMRDLPVRARRAGLPDPVRSVGIRVLQAAPDTDIYDLVVVDAPCTGSGTWARSPDAKWRTGPEDLDRYVKTQAQLLEQAIEYCSRRGALVYMTCSLFQAENRRQIDAFLARFPGWRLGLDRQFAPTDGGDGFYVAVLTRETS